MMAKSSNQTRKCPYCNSKSKLSNLRIISRVKNSQEAIEIIQKMKEIKVDPDRKQLFTKFMIKTKE
jgi:hypothetical protein